MNRSKNCRLWPYLAVGSSFYYCHDVTCTTWKTNLVLLLALCFVASCAGRSEPQPDAVDTDEFRCSQECGARRVCDDSADAGPCLDDCVAGWVYNPETEACEEECETAVDDCVASDACHEISGCSAESGCIERSVTCEPSDACHQIAECDPVEGCQEVEIVCEPSDDLHEVTGCGRGVGALEQCACHPRPASHLVVTNHDGSEEPIECEASDALHVVTGCDPDEGCLEEPVECGPSDECHVITGENAEDGCIEEEVVCEASDACHEVVECDPDAGCVETEITCEPSDACHEITGCDAEEGCIEAEITCEPSDACHEITGCDAEEGCIEAEITCEPSDACHEITGCHPEDGCVEAEITCEPSDVCHEVVECDVDEGCVEAEISCTAPEPCPLTTSFSGLRADGMGIVAYNIELPTPIPHSSPPLDAHPFLPANQGIYIQMAGQDRYDGDTGEELPAATRSIPFTASASPPHGLESFGVTGEVFMSVAGLELDTSVAADYYWEPPSIHRIYRGGTMTFWEVVGDSELRLLAEYENVATHMVLNAADRSTTGTTSGRLTPGSLALPSTYHFGSPGNDNCFGMTDGECYGIWDNTGEFRFDPCTESDACLVFSCIAPSGECVANDRICDEGVCNLVTGCPPE